ncbi:amino acid ABC transporter ATP-binding protein [Pelagibius litoralis]|uniref:Amino acid ABC transporter ATP-binding protein n=1 Tax=Pelagibius litoralis TaxID=374515 RepID=A0A967F1Q5_9PROT|nr:amino acid ABC transporter ATP-binding protein [Pelagibius litoralis]NIA71335.1 amino acid ABC transporter ATP-binding protein [Pelagibius litoralis]
MAEHAISFEKLNKYYGDHHALRDVTLDVDHGETLVICGPSGSGKSTLIRCVNGLEAYADGALSVLGHSVGDDERELEAVRKRVGMVFQSFNLFPHLTVLENCVLPQVRGIKRSRTEATQIAMGQLGRVRVAEHAHKFPDQISGGQKQRVALARSLSLDPDIMLFDEPTSALDPEMISEVLDVMQELTRGNMTIICVTHEMGFARAVADKVILMVDGAIVEQGDPEQMFTVPKHPITQDFMKAVAS